MIYKYVRVSGKFTFIQSIDQIEKVMYGFRDTYDIHTTEGA